MTVIKRRDKGPFFWHEYERNIPVLDHRGKPMFDEHHQPVYQKPKPDWYLPYEPVYILTNELAVSAQIFALKDMDPMTVDIINENMYGEETPWLYCSLKKELLTHLSI